MKSSPPRKRTIVIVHNVKPTNPRNPNGEEINEIASAYRFPRHRCLVFDFEYVRSVFTDFLNSPYPELKSIENLISSFLRERPVTKEVTYSIFKSLKFILLRDDYDVIFVDHFFINTETLPYWMQKYKGTQTTFVYLEIGKSNSSEVRFLMQEYRIAVMRVEDPHHLVSRARKELLQYIQD